MALAQEQVSKDVLDFIFRYSNVVLALLLAAEDNCLGIDFSDSAHPRHQPLLRGISDRRRAASIREMFVNILEGKNSASAKHLWSPKNPQSLAWLCASCLSRTFSCHLELCRRQWRLYEPRGKRSLPFWSPIDRESIRLILQDYGLSHRWPLSPKFRYRNRVNTRGVDIK